MNNTNPLSQLEKAEQVRTESYRGSERGSASGLTCNGDGFRKTELFSDYPPGASQSLTPVVMQNAKEIPGLSISATTDVFRESGSADINMLSESHHQISHFLTLQPALDQSRMGDQPSQEDQEEGEEGLEQDFLMEVKLETPELEEMIDMSSFTEGIYICEVSRDIFQQNIFKLSMKYFRFARRTRRRTTTLRPIG